MMAVRRLMKLLDPKTLTTRTAKVVTKHPKVFFVTFVVNYLVL